MKVAATHPKFNEWTKRTIDLDYPIHMTDKAVMVKGIIFQGGVWFPLSCVNVLGQFQIQVPHWLLKKKGLHVLTATCD